MAHILGHPSGLPRCREGWRAKPGRGGPGPEDGELEPVQEEPARPLLGRQLWGSSGGASRAKPWTAFM